MKLRAWRQREGLTATFLAAQLGVSLPSVSQWEKGNRTPKLDVMLRVKKYTKGAVCPEDFEKPKPKDTFVWPPGSSPS